MSAGSGHRFLVPFDGSFRTASARTKPPRQAKKANWAALLEQEATRLGDWQHRLYAVGSHAMLIVLQALDAAGKDGTIRHVFGRINPAGLRVASFKQPTPTETAHDFLWRTTTQLPRRGEVAVFNRSHYEEVLVVRVHPKFLSAQQVDAKPTRKFWAERYRAIVEQERHLAHSGTLILKFWLNVSKDEQRKRLLERIDNRQKHWKFREDDLDERDLWDRYQRAYQDCLNATSKPWAPWYSIPADDKGFMRWQVAKIVNDAFERLDLDFPKVGRDEAEKLAAARKRLLAE